MIPFASQRALGQDLATHLLNAHDNEYVEIADVRGAVAPDLHGAFAEWEAQAAALTKCQNYLYSLSINPDPAQGPLSRAQYLDYIARIEKRLGLSGQPRAVVFHIKEGREHCHVVWSRIDTEKEKAVHMAFDKDKLMMVTREFARDHKLELPDGYFREKGADKPRQLSVYEMAQQRATGLSREDHIERVTSAWRASDSAKSFVQALADKGYILATGKRPYVLVDFYGGMHALPRMIADKNVRAKDIRAFLEKDYPPESLPQVDEARKLIAAHRKSIESHFNSEQKAEALRVLERAQAARRQEQEKEWAALIARQQRERAALTDTHAGQRAAHRGAYLAQVREIKQQREERRPTGLAAFLGRITGVELIRRKIHQHQDKIRLRAFLADKEQLASVQRQERGFLQTRQAMQSLDIERQKRALAQLEAREGRSLEEEHRTDARITERGGRNQMPSLSLDLKPPGRKAVPHKAKSRYTSPVRAELRGKRRQDEDRGRIALPEELEGGEQGHAQEKVFRLSTEFATAAEETKGGDEQGSSGGPKPPSENKVKRYGPSRGNENDLDQGR